MGTGLAFVSSQIEIDEDVKDLVIDATHPRVISIRAYDKQTQSMRMYALKVTPKGGLVLV